MRLINTLRMIRGWWGEKDFWMATLADCLWRGRLWVVYHIANHVHEEENKKLGTTYSSETFDQRWSAISTCVARTRAGVTARVLSQAPTPHCTKLYRCVTVCDSVWQCVTLFRGRAQLFFRGKLTPLVLPLLLTTSRQLVNKRWTGIFSTCLNCASIFRGIPKSNKQ